MKRWYYVLFAIAPVAMGYAYNFLLRFALGIPVIAQVLLYVVPVAMLIFWGWAGRQFAKSGMSAAAAALVANSLGILSLALYIWQFVVLGDQSRIIWLAGLSQMFSAPVSTLTARVAVLFEPEKNVYGQVTALWMQILGLVLMALTFFAGFRMERRKLARSAPAQRVQGRI